MGRKIVLTGTKLSDLTAPKLPDVDYLESAGSLLLVDPTHPANPWASGVPAQGSALPNLLWERARDVIGSGSASSLAMTVENGAGWTGTAGKIERTAKGGLHGIISQGNSLAETRFRGSNPAVTAYIIANLTHAYFVSYWGRTTRAYPGGSTVPPEASSLSGLASVSSNYLYRNGPLPIGSPGLHQKNPTAWTGGTVPTSTSQTNQNYILHGRAGGMNTYSTTTQLVPSVIFYRLYIEDLTVSGRSYADVAALDNAEFTKHCLTAGGRYYADTFTDPTTIP